MLAFLDVMACGLGAVILILVVLKEQAPVDTTSEQPQQTLAITKPDAELNLLRNNLNSTLAAQGAIQSVLGKQSKITNNLINEIEITSAMLSNATAQTTKLGTAIETAKATLRELNNQLSNLPLKTPESSAPEYLSGLKVTGKKILVLLDRSASMSARELLQILQYKARQSADRQRAKKWVSAMNAVWWLLTQAPANASVQVASFSDTTTFHTDGWVKTKDEVQLAETKVTMSALYPDGSTNLQTAIDAAIKTGADSVYLITDGLPTMGPDGPSLFGLDGCGSKLSSRRQVTGKCRASLFQRAVDLTKRESLRISVILMPLEGDPEAAPLFSKWALSKGGVLLSAAKDWP